jgi:hypothetical protein
MHDLVTTIIPVEHIRPGIIYTIVLYFEWEEHIICERVMLIDNVDDIYTFKYIDYPLNGEDYPEDENDHTKFDFDCFTIVLKARIHRFIVVTDELYEAKFATIELEYEQPTAEINSECSA